MNLQTKSVLAFNVCIVFACVVMGLLGWFSANSGFDDALQVLAFLRHFEIQMLPVGAA